jgi:acyl phosphate:glycerol-3-phosphate acyltransferase
MIWIVILAIIGYISGSIPTGVIIGKKVKGIDIREVGSGNIGTANAIRALGPKWGGIVFLCDVLKGTLPVLLAIALLKWWPGVVSDVFGIFIPMAAGFGAVLGHNNSVFLGFSGGKGIATSFGVFLVLDYRAALIAFLVWIVVVVITKISSLGSLMGALSAPVVMIFFRQPVHTIIFAFVITAIAFYKHRENIGRILKGEERRITEKVSGTSD